MAASHKRKRDDWDALNRKSTKLAGIQRDGPVKRDLLRQAHASVLTVREYALLKLPSGSRLRRKKIAALGRGEKVPKLEAEISSFLDSTLVCGSAPTATLDETTYEQWLSFSQQGDESHVTLSDGVSASENTQSEIVDFVIWLLFSRETKASSWPKHLLCDGFRKRIKEGDPTGTSIPDVYSVHPNHHATDLKRQPWPQFLALLGKSGQKIMVELLVDCSIFVSVDAGLGNYYQLSGCPLSELDVNGNNASTSKFNDTRKPSDVAFARNRIFYAKATLTSRGRIQPGYKHVHILNRCPHSQLVSSDGSCTEADDAALSTRRHQNQANTIKVMMYMFPRQFRLHNVFTSKVNSLETAQKFQDYTLRDEEINPVLQAAKERLNGLPKLPRRLRGSAWNLVERLQILHARCSYAELLRHYCLSVLEHRRSSGKAHPPLEQSRRQDHGTVQHTSREPHNETQSVNPSNVVGGIVSTNNNLPGRDGHPLESLVDLATPTSRVSAFCRAVLSHIIPNEFWGQGDTLHHNKTLFLQKVDRFVNLRRFESLTLHDVSQGLKVGDIGWLTPIGQPEHSKSSQTDIRKRYEIFHEALYYFFDSLLIPLIRSNFYVTESNTHRYRVFYFRHDIWRRIAEPAFAELKANMFHEVKLGEANDILDSRRLGFSQMRLLPKGKKLRPIMNLRRRQMSRKATKLLGPSINSILGPVHTVLRFEKGENPQHLGSTLFSVSDMYERLKTFKASIGSANQATFYFAKVDVQAAFDTIPQQAVVQLMRSVPSHTRYIIMKHAEVQPGERALVEPKKTATKAIRRWHATAMAEGEELPFTERLDGGLANKKKNTVFVDGVAQKHHDAAALLQLLADHVQRNLIKVGKKYYRQKQGIPQGSVLSSFMCNYFYADLERRHLQFLQGQDCLLMRLIDDFLLITLDRSKAERFVQVMHAGMPEYGVQVSRKKTLVNFDMRVDGDDGGLSKVKSGSGFPYCGTLINDLTLEITKDRDRSERAAIANSLTIEFGRAPGQNFQRKILNAFKIQSHLMFFDTSHNTAATVLESLRTAFCETARKMWAYIRCLPKAQQPKTSLITGTIAKVAEVAFLILSSKSRRLRYPHYSCDIRKGQVISTAYTAFLEVLSRKQSQYGSVIAWLRKQDKKLSAM